jgi:hypothetical protein
MGIMDRQPQERGLRERLEHDEPGAHVHRDGNGHPGYWACGPDCGGDERDRLGLPATTGGG